MTHHGCQQAQDVRREVYRVTRQQMAAILTSPPEAREALATRAMAELKQARAAAYRQLPTGGCGGVLCLTPFFNQLEAQLQTAGHQASGQSSTLRAKNFRKEVSKEIA